MNWVKKILFKLGIINGYWDGDRLCFRIKKDRAKHSEVKFTMNFKTGKMRLGK